MDHSQLGKRVKELRSRKAFSQEQLAEETGLSLRTIQRIEKNETIPRGDTLKKLAYILGTSPDEILDWKMEEDQNYLILMSLSPFGFLVFPLLGIILPLILWVHKKDKIERVNHIGKSILNFQISWTLALFLGYCLLGIVFLFALFLDMGATWKLLIWQTWLPLTIIFYLFNIIVIARNSLRIRKKVAPVYKPSLSILGEVGVTR